jgi:hypothetical protein
MALLRWLWPGGAILHSHDATRHQWVGPVVAKAEAVASTVNRVGCLPSRHDERTLPSFRWSASWSCSAAGLS